MSDDSDERELELPGMDAELEEEDTEMTYMYPEGNVDLLGVDMEWKEPSSQVFDIDDTNIPQYPSLIDPEVPAEPDGPTQVLTPSTEGQ